MELSEFLKELDYTGTFSEVVARLSTEALEEFERQQNSSDDSNFLYFGLRRFAVEIGTPNEIVKMDLKPGSYLFLSAVVLLNAARMARLGWVEVDWPENPFANPEQSFAIRKTVLGEKRHAELKRKFESEDLGTANGNPQQQGKDTPEAKD